MTPQDVKLVQESYAKVQPIAETASELFYGRLFEVAPEVRPMFPDDMTKQRENLMKTLDTVVLNLHQVEKIIPSVQDLGRRHVGYGVKDAHYDTVGGSLLWTLEKGLGEAYTTEVKEAWTKAYTTLATVMKDAAAEVKPEPAKAPGFFARLFGDKTKAA